jgi:hypothetical protein
MADTKATKAAAAKAPRYPRGQQGFGMNTSTGNTSTGSVTVRRGRSGDDTPGGNYDNPQGGRQGTFVFVEGATKKEVDRLMKTAMKSKSAGIKSDGKQKLVAKQKYNSPIWTSSEYREYQSAKKKTTKK